VTRLRRSDPSAVGILRRRRGSGWSYLAPDGSPVRDPATLERCQALVLPPAWTDVWISHDPLGHIQAMGTDVAGRRQYRYHEEWRRQRDLVKFDRVLEFADLLPGLRARVAEDIALPGMPKRRVLACAARLLDVGFFRIGSEEYAEQNQTFGLATVLREHVSLDSDGNVTFEYTAKSGKHRVTLVADPNVVEVIGALLARAGDPNPELLAFLDESEAWVDIKSRDINGYLQEVSEGAEITAKDFRTWNATVLCAVALGVSEEAVTSPSSIKRAISRAVQETADYLGNTPAVCRSSYIHPKIIDLFEGGITLAEDLDALGDKHQPGALAVEGAFEHAVAELLRDPQAVRMAHRRQRLAARAATRAAARSGSGVRRTRRPPAVASGA